MTSIELEVRVARFTTEKSTDPPTEYETIGKLRVLSVRPTNGGGEVVGIFPGCPWKAPKDQVRAAYLFGETCAFHFAWLAERTETPEGPRVVLRYRKAEGELPAPAEEPSREDSTHHGHHEPGFVRKYIFSTDHKVIGIQYIVTAILFGLVGGLLAMGVRWQLAFPFDPDHPVPILGATLFKDQGGIMDAAWYNQFVTMHGTIMVFFFIIPLLVGGFGNFLIPLQIGADDMAFPRINMWSYWVYLAAGILMLASFFVPGGAHQGGWTSYAPLATAKFQPPAWEVPGLGIRLGGVDLWILSIATVGASSIMGALNYITTILNYRAPGMTMMRLPLFTWASFVTAILNILAVPVLTAGGIMLFFDRILGTHFFDPANGGQVLLWQHVFWFFGHPEVYIIVLPGMGVISEILPTFSRKPIFGYLGMVIAMCAIGFLGFIVWGHHMFTSGMSPIMGKAFMIGTLAIAVPSAIKVFNWIGTLWGGKIRFEPPLLAGVGFVAMFIMGGLSGIFLASSPVDTYVHDTYFVVAHFHYVAVSAAIFAIIGGLYYWFPKMTGRMPVRWLGIVHIVLTFVFLNATFGPMHFAGLAGHMRRIAQPTYYETLQALAPMNLRITMAAFGLFLTQILFFVNLGYALFFGRKAGANPWEANTLEWAAPSPPPHGNFPEPVVVHHGPYEYSHPAAPRDYAPQNVPLPAGAGGHA